MSIRAKFNIQRGHFHLDVDLNLPSKGVTALFGPSGSGKTSLLRAIAGLDCYERGELQIDDSTWQVGTTFRKPHERPIGYVFQEASLFEHLSVAGNLGYGLKRVPEEKRRISLQSVIELLDISPLLEQKPDQLSGGERQRVAIARALSVSPRLLLMDEPLAGLDEKRKQGILPYIESLHKELEIPVLYVSHSSDEVARLADHLVLVDSGKAKEVGPIQEMLTRLDLPLAQGPDAEALLGATVSGHDEEFHLTYLDSPAGRFTVVRKELPLGESVRLRVAAKDVSLTLEPQSDTSILNIFPATVSELAPSGIAQSTVRLDARGTPLLARVTQKSVAALGLQVGKRVFAQAKSVALLA
ncbi:MAG: molybdenum ABC transporter ATP-binding protein [Planctomycetota bacterium]|jgi:molybdate transport system ATP-binding protein|nr:molybdenum ABC transporter ATP-binding protein [Planctomycetota bacterium]MDP6941613.1 molybdenum ABC transporter ATP-binding protein [Planctomycetota bacterium]